MGWVATTHAMGWFVGTLVGGALIDVLAPRRSCHFQVACALATISLMLAAVTMTSSLLVFSMVVLVSGMKK